MASWTTKRRLPASSGYEPGCLGRRDRRPDRDRVPRRDRRRPTVTGPAEPVRVLIVDDDALVRAGLSMMLDGSDGIAVVGEAADGDQVGQAVDTFSARCGADGPAHATRRRDRRYRLGAQPPTPARSHRADHLRRRRKRRFAPCGPGASGFLLKDSPPAEIAAAVRRVAAGDPILSPQITRRLMDRAAMEGAVRDDARSALDALSPREREVVLAIAQGRTNAEIGAELAMSVPTVKAHITHILTKLQLTNRTQIALLAHDAGLA